MNVARKILICGAHRTGSTAIFNLTRTICLQYGTVYSCFEDQYNINHARGFYFEVVKAHKYKRQLVDWADMIITVFREPEDMWASMQRFSAVKGHDAEGKRDFSIQDVWRGLAWWGMYQKHSDYSVNFNQIERCPEKLAHEIAQRIGVKIRPKEIVRQFLEIVPPEKGYDPVTLLHANHITKEK